MLSGSSNISEQVNSVFLIFLIICVALLVLITTLMIWFVIKYRRSRNPSPDQTEGNILLEITWLVIPTILVLVMFFIGWSGYRTLRNVPEDAMPVKVYARMWSWMFQYENGVQSNVLRLPVGKPVQLTIISADVLHSFYVPAFRIKQDAVPGMENHVWFAASDTGSYDVFCAEYCGDRHAYMHSEVRVVPQESFDDWLEREGETAEKRLEAMEAGQVSSGSIELKRWGANLLETKGCSGCHSTDGTEKVGPTFKGIFGRTSSVITNGEEREIIVDEDYIRRSTKEPKADIG